MIFVKISRIYMKISDYKVGTTFETTAVKRFNETHNQVYYDSIGIIKEHAYMWGRKPEDVINIKATIIEEDVLVDELMKGNSGYDHNSIDYFGQIDFEKGLDNLSIGLIYHNIKCYFICFPYGADCYRFWSDDHKNFETGEYIHKKGDRRRMNVRLKIEEI